MTQNELMNARLDGVVRSHACRVKIEATGTGKDDPSHRLDIKIDFTGWTVQDIVDMAISPLVIARQRVWREMSVEALKAENGKTFMASDMGKKPSQQVDVQAAFMARFAAASAEDQAKMLAELQAKVKQG